LPACTRGHVRDLCDPLHALPPRGLALGAGSQQLPDRLGGPRAGEVEALADVTAERLELIELLAGLDAVGDRDEPERMRHVDHGGDDRRVFGLVAELAHERAVHLQDVERKALERAERRLARAEVVQAQNHAELLERRERAKGPLLVLGDDSLGDLEAEARGIDTARVERPAYRVDEPGIAVLARRDVDRDPKRSSSRPGFAP